jgi:predicted Zn-dependent protease
MHRVSQPTEQAKTSARWRLPGLRALALAATGGLALSAALVAPVGAAAATSTCSSSTTSEVQLSSGEYVVGPEINEAEEQAFNRSTAGTAQAVAAVAGVDVDVYIHNFYRTNSQQLSYQQVVDQLNRLNMSFAGGQGGSATRFEFVLRAYESIHVSNARVEVTSARANRLKRSQHEGGRATLNIYTANHLYYRGGEISGYTTPPWRVKNQPLRDGVWLRRGVMPGVPGGPSYRDAGDVLVHEVGHWLGLYHVYQGYCDGRGDRVADTGRMSQASAQLLTCETRDTCGNDRGLSDPVRNFMSSGGDGCLDLFTAGQARRMSNQWNRYRA